MVNHSIPPQIARKIACCYTMELRHPLPEPAAISINILNVVNIVDNSLTCGNVDWAMSNFCIPGDLSVCRHSICAKNDMAL